MDSLNSPFKEEFLQRLFDQFLNVSERGPLHKMRCKSWDHFLELGLPSRHTEVYRYVNLRKLYSQTFFPTGKSALSKEEIEERSLPEKKQTFFTFINGHYSPQASSFQNLPSHSVILPLQDAIKSYGAFLNNNFSQTLKEETDPFAVLNGAFHSAGAFLYFPPKTVLEHPIQILNIIDTKEQNALLMPRIHLFLGTCSQVEINVVNDCLSGESFFCNQLMDATLEEGASFCLNQVCLGLSERSWMFDAVRVVQKRDSTFRSIAVTDGAETIRGDYKIKLKGENAEASLNGLWLLDNRKQAHTNVFVDHQAPHCRSMQLFKGVLDGASSSSFEGKIFVGQAAQKTDAFQLNNNLLLSDTAKAESKPNLEIFADDVKASHGATVGQLDAEQAFYLQARGFKKDLAKKLLVKAYCQEVINKIGSDVVRNKIRGKLSL